MPPTYIFLDRTPYGCRFSFTDGPRRVEGWRPTERWAHAAAKRRVRRLRRARAAHGAP